MGKKKIILVTLECEAPSVVFPSKAITEGAIVLSIRTRKGGNGKKTRLGKTLINANAFQSTTMTLKDKGGDSIVDSMPLEYVEHDSFNGDAKGTIIDRSDIDWNTSIINFNDESAVIASEQIEFLIEIEL